MLPKVTKKEVRLSQDQKKTKKYAPLTLVLRDDRVFYNVLLIERGDDESIYVKFPRKRGYRIKDSHESVDIPSHIIFREKFQDNIQLLGKLSRRQVMNYMAQSKILLHTSSHESQGYMFMEALYCGMTVVSFDVGYQGQTGKAIRCLSKEKIIVNLRNLLKQQLNYDRVLLKPIEETVSEFRALYAV